MATQTVDADLVADALAKVWTECHREFGPDENQWRPGEVREYLLRLEAARNDPQVVA